MNFSWGHHRRFNTYPEYIKKVFGGRVQKLTIDAGLSCPNRDGTKRTGGCTFCLNDAFNPSYCMPEKSVQQQLQEGIMFHEKRYRRASQYLAYFQAYSNTHATLKELIALYEQAISMKGVVGIVIGTRPDCVDNEKLDYFRELAKRTHVIIEYGIESVNDVTLERVNRGHSFSETVKALHETASRGIPAGGHMIFGLPGESILQMMKSAEILSELPLTSLKFHQLQIFKNTAMAKEFVDNPRDFHVFSEEEYLHFLADYISRLNPDFIIERIAGETPPRYALLQPWGPRYDVILRKFESLLEEMNLWQGKFYKPKGTIF